MARVRGERRGAGLRLCRYPPRTTRLSMVRRSLRVCARERAAARHRARAVYIAVRAAPPTRILQRVRGDHASECSERRPARVARLPPRWRVSRCGVQARSMARRRMVGATARRARGASRSTARDRRDTRHRSIRCSNCRGTSFVMNADTAVRKRAVLIACVALGLAAAPSACGRFGDKSAQTAATDRVVCVSKQLNEFMYAIGAEQHLVAVDLTSIYPPQIKKLPTVGYHRALSAEGIISMRPTLFLTDGNVGPSAVLDQLKKVGIPIETMLPGNTLDSAQQLLLRLGDKFGRRGTADSVLAQWKAGMQDVWRDTVRYAGK